MPSRALLGLKTDSGWKVVKDLNAKSLGSGGNFCTRWIVESECGKIGFMKAMDISIAVSKGLESVKALIDTYLFEQHILEECKKANMTKVVTPLDAGELKVASHSPPLNQVYYIIFDLADGDLRQEYLDQKHNSWLSVFKALHHVCTGAAQLHRAQIAHQDIKPSNVLLFSKGAKLSDLGRVTDAAGRSPFTSILFTGDRSYEPIEGIYRQYTGEFIDRYYSDVYMVGSLAYHLVSNVQITATLIDVSRSIMPTVLNQSYINALPTLTLAFNRIIEEYYRQCTSQFGAKVAEDLRCIVFEMCHPDKSKRGAPKLSSPIPKISLERYVGKFATLVTRAKVEGIV